MKRFVILTLAALAATAAFASAQHTVMWYVGHPAEMKRVLAACNNDPGDAKNTSDCENVFRAEVVISTAEAQQHANVLLPPSDPRYWRIHPDELPWMLATCSRLTPTQRKLFYGSCESAFTAVKQ
jgi:hypothetical protein